MSSVTSAYACLCGEQAAVDETLAEVAEMQSKLARSGFASDGCRVRFFFNTDDAMLEEQVCEEIASFLTDIQ